MKIKIADPFYILERPASVGGISQKLIEPASCDVFVENNIMTVTHPADRFQIPQDHFQELVDNGTIKIVEQ
jgi:hypothetical protein